MSKYHTYISKKQIGVIFSNWKKGNLDLTEEDIKCLYNSFAEVKGFNTNNNFEDCLVRVKRGIESIFDGNIEEAQEQILSGLRLYHAIYEI